MKEASVYSENYSEQNFGILFLDVLCTYFETEKILDKEQMTLFRKQWLAED